jgi:hypothetical protein
MRDNFLDKIAAELPAEISSLVPAVGFHKVASVLTGVDTSAEGSVYASIGSRLMQRRKEAALISRGLQSLSALGED